eukprot:TRINITY_DN99_c3_g1_i1.p1 TRINITY_DN99_c3_g1~~TRINITY_DN99_c3_g1_i1.p1  ORF type:complete len:389 (+),score=68.22 TRINITY_DN99_c3_g1_i1:6-1172(+)
MLKKILYLSVTLTLLLSVALLTLYYNEELRTETLTFLMKNVKSNIIRTETTQKVPFDKNTNRQWLLKQRPEGKVTKDLFEFSTSPVPKISKGQALVRNVYLSYDASQRWWVEKDSYKPASPLGKPFEAVAVAVVVESNIDSLRVGDHILFISSWQDYVVVEPNSGYFPLPNGVPPLYFLSRFGLTTLTAYFGIYKVGSVRSGDTVVVSGAAGATGLAAGQIAKALGATKVIGIAGGAEKCKLLKDYGFDYAIDYKTENIDSKFKEYAPNGIDVYFDNVGGEVLETVLNNIADYGRIAISGAISTYDTSNPPIVKNYLQLLLKQAKMEGFLTGARMSEYPLAYLHLYYLSITGKLQDLIDLRVGFEEIPETFVSLFSGANKGKLVHELK